MGVPEEPMRIEIGSGRIQWRGVSQRSCPTGTRPFSLPYVEEKIILHIFGDLTFFFFSRVGEEGSRKQASEVTVGLPVEGTPIQQSGAVERHPHPQRAGETTRISVDLETLRAVSHSKIYFYTYTLSRVESRAKWGRGGCLKAVINILYLQNVFLKALMFDKNECLCFICFYAQKRKLPRKLLESLRRAKR